MHSVGLLNAPEDEVTNVEGSFPDVAIMTTSKLFVMTSLSHDSSKPLLFEVVEVDAACLFSLSFLVELDVWSSKGDVSG
jgi:hypothetical protein